MVQTFGNLAMETVAGKSTILKGCSVPCAHKNKQSIFKLKLCFINIKPFFLSPPFSLAHGVRLSQLCCVAIRAINFCNLGILSMQWLTCASDRLAKQTHDNCDKHGVIYEMPLLKCLASRNIPSSTIWGYHKY